MATIDQRLTALETEQEEGFRPLPLVVPEDTSDEELARLKCGGRVLYRSGDPDLYNEFV